MGEHTVQMVWTASVVTWDDGKEAGSPIGTRRLKTTESRVLDLIRSSEPSPVGLRDNPCVDALKRISTAVNDIRLLTVELQPHSSTKMFGTGLHVVTSITLISKLSFTPGLPSSRSDRISSPATPEIH